jgi:hypothetical protein
VSSRRSGPAEPHTRPGGADPGDRRGNDQGLLTINRGTGPTRRHTGEERVDRVTEGLVLLAAWAMFGALLGLLAFVLLRGEPER